MNRRWFQWHGRRSVSPPRIWPRSTFWVNSQGGSIIVFLGWFLYQLKSFVYGKVQKCIQKKYCHSWNENQTPGVNFRRWTKRAHLQVYFWCVFTEGGIWVGWWESAGGEHKGFFCFFFGIFVGFLLVFLENWKIPHFWPQFPQKSSIFWPTNCIFYANEKFANGAENFLSPPQHEVCSASWGILKDFPCNLQFFLLYPLNYFLFLAVGVIFWGWGCSTPYPSLSTPGSTPPHTADHVCLMHTLFMSRAKRLPFFTNVYATYSRVLCCFLSSVLIIHIRMLTYLLLRPFVFFIVSSFRSRCWELLHHFVLWLPSSA